MHILELVQKIWGPPFTDFFGAPPKVCLPLEKFLRAPMRIDWNVNDNRLRYTNHVDRLSMSITPPTDVSVNRETAQLQVDAKCQQIVKCIQMASDCVTKKNSQSKATKKQNPWWTQSTKIAKSRKSF